MPANPGRNEQVFIRHFVSAYEDFAWAGSSIDRLDERKDGAIDALITRSDGKTMAVEHTLIEPFVDDKSDFAMFEKEFLEIERDKSLAVPNTAITVFIPVGILEGERPTKRSDIVESIRSWIASNRLTLKEGTHPYRCDVKGKTPITITVKRSKFAHPLPNAGTLSVRRQQMKSNLDKVIEKALRRKLPKLVNTSADRHLLLLERDQLTFDPDLIFSEIELQRPTFPLIERIDEIWHVETIFFKQGGYVDFELWKGGKVRASMAFQNDVLIGRSKDGKPLPI